MKAAIAYPDFDKIDIRVGTVMEASLPDWSRKLVKLVVDFGGEIGQRPIFTGVKEWYLPSDFQDKQFLFLVNLEPKKMGEEYSQGMILMADGEKPILLPLPQTIANGTIIR